MMLLQTKTMLGSNRIELVRGLKFGKHNLTTTIGIYRDGFHLSIRNIDYLKNSEKLLQYVFGDLNSTIGWTQEIEKVAPMMNSIIKDIEQFFQDNK